MLMGEIITAVAYKLPIKLVIIKNNTLGQIKWEQMVFQGNPEYQCDLFPIDFVALAKAVGASGVRIDDPKRRARNSMRLSQSRAPVIIEAVVDQLLRCFRRRSPPIRRSSSLKLSPRASPIA